jgi:glycosyltransferase involved in cell wall biosynthesis
MLRQSSQRIPSFQVLEGGLSSIADRRSRARLSVLHVLAPGSFGGLEQVVQMLAVGHAELGHDVHVAALVTESSDAHPFTRRLAGGPVNVHEIVLPPRRYLAQARALAALYRRHEPVVVHTHGYHADLIAGRIARKHNIPVISTAHGFTGGDWKNRCYEWLQQREFRSYDRVVAVSKPMVSRLVGSGIRSNRVVLLPNAWRPKGEPLDRADARAALGVPDHAFHIGWVGRVSAEKGLDILVSALPHLADLPVFVSVIGDGAERSRVHQLAVRLGVADRITWQGVRADAWRLFPAFDSFVLSSRTEGTPIVLFEAMSANVPIVATEVGGVPHVVSGNEALLVAPENPRALADSIRLAQTDPSAARKRARAARSRLRADFSIDAWLDEYANLYRSLLR